MKKLLTGLFEREAARFAAVGLVNTGLDLVIYFVLQSAGVPFLLANLISTSAGLAFSFLANRVFTFASRPTRSVGRQFALFVACTGIGLWLVQPIVILSVESLMSEVRGPVEAQILLSKTVAIVVGVAWNWFLYNKVVFRADRSTIAAVLAGGSASS